MLLVRSIEPENDRHTSCKEPHYSLKVTRDQNVHCRAVSLLAGINLIGFLGRVLLIATGLPEAVQNIVLIGSDNQLVDRQAHLSSEVSRKDVSEVSSRSDKSDLVPNLEGIGLSRKREVRVKVEDDLGENSREVNRVDSTQLQGLVGIRIAEQSLDNILTIIECALDGEVVYVAVNAGCHLSLLDRANTSLGVQNCDRNILLASETVDSSGSSISTCRANDGQVVTVLAHLSMVFAHEQIFEKISKELEGAILEGVAGAVEKLQNVEVILELHQRNDFFGAECRVASVDDRFQVFGGDFRLRDVQAHNLESKVGV